MRESILIVSPKTSGIGGVAQHVSKLAQLLRERGYEVDIISCENAPCIRRRGLANPSFILSSSLKAMLSGRYDVVNAHNVPSAPAMRLARAERRVLTIHGVFSEQVSTLHRGLYPRLAKLLEGLAVGWADTVTLVSRQALEAYRRLYPRGRFAYVPNAIDLRDLPPPGEARRLYDPQVVYVGRLSREKGVDVYVEAARLLPDAHFLVVGDGPLRGELEGRAPDNVHFLGYMERGEALRLVAGSDVYVQPSRKEGLSTSLLEAMALRVPVVASRVGGNVELVRDGVTGLLVAPDDPSGLAGAVGRVLGDRGLASRLAEEAYRLVENEYSWSRVVELYLEVFGLA